MFFLYICVFKFVTFSHTFELYSNDQADTEARQVKDHNMGKYFKSEWSRVDWEIECSGDDVSNVYGNFINKFDYL